MRDPPNMWGIGNGNDNGQIGLSPLPGRMLTSPFMHSATCTTVMPLGGSKGMCLSHKPETRPVDQEQRCFAGALCSVCSCVVSAGASSQGSPQGMKPTSILHSLRHEISSSYRVQGGAG